MSEVLDIQIRKSPVKGWPGHIVLPSYMTYEQLLVWKDCIDKSGKAGKEAGETTDVIKMFGEIRPAIIDIIEEWHIDRLKSPVTIKTLPGSSDLIAWLIDEITKLYERTNGEDIEEGPKSPEPSSTT